MEETPDYTGMCPHCEEKSDFFTPTAGQTAAAMAKELLTLATDAIERRNPLKRYARDNGELGRCSKCNKPVLKCPRCGKIHRREHEPSPCDSCGKVYGHP